MGLINKLKSSMDGGVQVHIQAPSAVPSNQVIQVNISITTESSQTINCVRAEIKAQAREQGLAMGGVNGGIGVQENRTMEQTVAQVESREPFAISPGETKTVSLQLYLNGGAAGDGKLGQLADMGGVMGGLVHAISSFEHVNYIYSVHAFVEVQGHSLKPGDKQPIQILPPSENLQVTQQPNIENLQPQNQTVIPNPDSSVNKEQSQTQPNQPTNNNPAN